MSVTPLTPESVFQGIEKILIDGGFVSGPLTRETHLAEDLNIDSIDMVEIVLQLEREFNVVLDDRQSKSCKTVQDLTVFVVRSFSTSA